MSKYRYVVSCGLREIPHISEAEKERMIASYPPHEREARINGLPALGSGSVYYVDESLYTINTVEIYPHWPRVFALDVAQHTSCIWAAIDPNTDILYVYDEQEWYMEEPPMIVHGIKAKGRWIKGVVDPSAVQGSKRGDGDSLYKEYKREGLNLITKVDNGVESGITRTIKMMLAGTLKITKNCHSLLGEIRMYYRNDRGEIAGHQKDHLCDALRYLTGTGKKIAKSQNEIERELEDSDQAYINYSDTRNKTTGY